MIKFVLNNSKLNSMPIIIVYQKGDEITQRKIKVNSIDKGIIQAYCYKRRSIRNFKMENVLAAIKIKSIN